MDAGLSENSFEGVQISKYDCEDKKINTCLIANKINIIHEI